MKSLDIYNLQLREIRDEQIWPERNNTSQQKTAVVKNEPAPDIGEAGSLKQAESEGKNITRGR